jgi:transposase
VAKNSPTGIGSKGSYLKDKYHRLKARRGANRAGMAIAHKILMTAYHMLTNGTDYVELGDAYLDKLAEKRITRGLVRRLTNLGYKVRTWCGITAPIGECPDMPPC